MNKRPRRTPFASGPPPAASATTIIASPITSIAVDRILVAWRCTGGAYDPPLSPAIAGRPGAPASARPAPPPPSPVPAGAVRVDDRGGGACGELGLDGLAEQRPPRSRR